MKYVSKNQNLCLVLRSGIPPEPITGRLAVSGLYARFKDGFLNIDEAMAQRMGVEYNELIKLIESQPAFGEGFEKTNEDDIDPWKDYRREAEPKHNISELKHGSIKNLTPVSGVSFTKDQQAMVKKIAGEMAKEMAKEMVKDVAPKIAMEMVKEMVKKQKSKKGKTGRPKKKNVGAVVEKIVPPEENLVPEEKLVPEENLVPDENTRGASQPENSAPIENKTDNLNK